MNKRMRGTYKSETIKGERRCVFCGEWKALESDFARNGTDANGEVRYRQDCKVCYNIRRKENKAKKVHSDFIGGQKRRGEAAPALSHQEWKECLLYFGGACAYCGETPKRYHKLTKDHLEPISQGGKTVQSNIIPACTTCNSSKGADNYVDWYSKQAFFKQGRLDTIIRWKEDKQ